MQPVRRSREHIVDKIVEGKLNDYYKRSSLLDQPYIRCDDGSPITRACSTAVYLDQVREAGAASLRPVQGRRRRHSFTFPP